MDFYYALKTLHIVSSTILFGTGIGIAFFMLRSLYTDNIHEKIYATKNTVQADYYFTLPAGIVQPLSGFALVYLSGINVTSTWLTASFIVYIIAGLCWLPVVWIQIQLRNMCIDSLNTGSELPKRYYTLFKVWFFLGWPAFVGLIVIFYLMVTKPI